MLKEQSKVETIHTRQLFWFPQWYKFCSYCQCNGRTKNKTPGFYTCETWRKKKSFSLRKESRIHQCI